MSVYSQLYRIICLHHTPHHTQFPRSSHVSTAYVNSHRLGHVAEALPPLPRPAEEQFRELDTMSDEEMERREKALLGCYPNTYTFSKALAEHLIIGRAAARGVRLTIVRPTIVGAALAEPFPGWTDAVSAVGAIVLFVGIGLLRHVYGKPITRPDVVPVDYVASGVIAAVVNSGAQRRDAPPLIVHSGLGIKGVTWDHWRVWLIEYFAACPMERAVADPFSEWIRSRVTFQIYIALAWRLPLRLFKLLLHVVPRSDLRRKYMQLEKITNGIVKNSHTFAHF